MAETIKWRPFDSTEATDVDESTPFPVAVYDPVTGGSQGLPVGGALTFGTKSLTTTASFQVSSVSVPCKMLTIQNDPDNTVDILVGGLTGQVIQIIPGQSFTMPVTDVSLVYAKNNSSTTQTVNWMSVN